jgi:hypothetical protein
MKTIKTIGLVVAGIVVGLLFSVIGSNSAKLGSGVYNQTLQYFYDGINVGKSGQFTVSNVGRVAVSGTGTTTLSLTSSTSGSGSCIQMKTTNGSTTKIYLAGTTTVLTIAEGTCE